MQHPRLFEQGFHEYREEKIREACLKARALSQQDLLDPTLLAKIDAIADQFRFVVASLKPEERRGKPRIEKRRSRDYGELCQIDVSLIDVTIPFDGWPKSFFIAPSHCHLIDTPASHDPRGLTATFHDDDNLDRNVDNFIHQVAENLDRLRSEMENLKPQSMT